MKTTIFKFHYKDHLVRALVLDGRGYVLGPDVMPLFGYKKRPLVDINWLLEEGVDKEFIYDVPVIGLAGVFLLRQYPYIKRKKAQKVFEWVEREILSVLEGRRNLPDEVRTESWEEADFKSYLEKEKQEEDKRLEAEQYKKTIFEICSDEGLIAKVKIKRGKCSIQNVLESFLRSFIYSEVGENPDGVDVLDVLHKINREVMTNILKYYKD